MLRMQHHGLRPVEQFRSDMDCIIEDVFGARVKSLPQVGGGRGNPPLDVWEENDDFFVTLEVPGATQGDVQLTALGRELTLVGDRGGSEQPADQETAPAAQESENAESEAEAAKPIYYHRERLAGPFHRVIRFPFDIDGEQVEGTLTAGVLTVRVPKAASAKPRRIEIGTN